MSFRGKKKLPESKSKENDLDITPFLNRKNEKSFPKSYIRSENRSRKQESTSEERKTEKEDMKIKKLEDDNVSKIIKFGQNEKPLEVKELKDKKTIIKFSSEQKQESSYLSESEIGEVVRCSKSKTSEKENDTKEETKASGQNEKAKSPKQYDEPRGPGQYEKEKAPRKYEETKPPGEKAKEEMKLKKFNDNEEKGHEQEKKMMEIVGKVSASIEPPKNVLLVDVRSSDEKGGEHQRKKPTKSSSLENKMPELMEKSLKM